VLQNREYEKIVLYAYQLSNYISTNDKKKSVGVGSTNHGSILFFPTEQFNEKLIPTPEYDVTKRCSL